VAKKGEGTRRRSLPLPKQKISQNNRTFIVKIEIETLAERVEGKKK
jgi:hypothetical protein